MGKSRIHVSLDETLLKALKERADREHCHQSDVVAAALHRELSPELFDRAWAERLGRAGIEQPNGNGDPDIVSSSPAHHRHPATAHRPGF